MRAVLMALIIVLLSGGAIAQVISMCGERGKIVANLKKIYSEEPVAIGLSSNGGLIEILVSPTGTFTIILTQPNGWACVMAAGEDWENHKPLPGYMPLREVPT